MATFNEKLTAAGRGDPPAVAALTFLNDLGSEDRAALREVWATVPTERRRFIVGELTTMAEDNIDLDFRHVFLIALQDSDPQVRLASIEGLYEDESRLLLGRLIEMLRNDPDEAVREAATVALGRFTYIAHCSDKLGTQAGKLRETLLASARDEMEEGDVRRRAVESLGYFHGDEEVQQLIKEAYEGGGTQAESALFAMGRNLDEQWSQVIMDELESYRAAMRYEAARAAGEVMMADALPFLARMINDKDTEVRLAAIGALGQIGGKPAAEALQQAARSKEPAIREAAQEALEEISFHSDPLNVGK